MVVSFCSTSHPALLKNTNEKHSYIPVKMGGGHRPVVERNRHNWCSVGVTTSFPTCLEIETVPFFCVYSVFYTLKYAVSITDSQNHDRRLVVRPYVT